MAMAYQHTNMEYICNTCNESKGESQYGVYTDTRTGRQRRRHICKSCRTKVEGVRSRENLDRTNGYKKTYRDTHKDEIRDYERERVAHKYKTDAVFRKRQLITRQLCQTIKSATNVNVERLNCDKVRFMKWIAYQFKDGWSFEDRKKWNFDHVIPVTFFDLENPLEEALACHWSNVRPIDPNENRRKSGKILKDVILSHIEVIKAFLSENDGYQASLETCWWQRVELWYGKNPNDSENFTEFLQRTIRSQC